MAIDPNIALGYRGVELANPLAQYGQLAQIQNAQNQNALAQYQLSAAQRSDEQQNALYAAAKRPDFKLDFQSAIQYGAPGIAAYKAQQEAAGLALTQTKTQGEINAQQAKAAMDRVDAFSTALAPLVSSLQSGKPVTHNEVFAQANRLVSQGLLRKEDLASIPMNALELPKFVMGMATSTENSRKALLTYLPKTRDRDIGGQIQSVQDNPMLPGYSMPVAGGDISKTPTIGEITGQGQLRVSQGQLRVSQGQLGLAQQKFAFEKANPGYELKEDADGNFFGVNKRTLQSFPVMIGGGAAPTAAPMVPSAGGMPGPRMAQPGAVVPAIPGMTSVLDQTMPAATPAAVGGPRQLVGKGTALTESQGAAAAYGIRMKEANSILTPLEKTGVKNTGLISNVVGSAVGIVPLIGDKLEGMSGSVFNALPQVLGGLSPEQQQVAQARINFITAVLRKESGASISPSEFTTAEKNYFPKPGDDAPVVAQKQKARDLAIKTMEMQAGQGAKHIQQYVPSNAAGAPTVSNW